MQINKVKSIAEIIMADLLWGFGFVATVWSLQSFTLFQSLFLRFLIIFLLAIPFIFPRYKISEVQISLKISLLPSLFLFGEIGFQMWGLQYTTPAKAGFITILFVVIVPLFEKLFYRRDINKLHGLWVGISLLGVKCIVGYEPSAVLNFGDGIIFISCLSASLHIISIDRLKTDIHKPFDFNLFQCFWCLIFCLPLFLFEPIFIFKTIKLISIVGLLTISIGTTMLAFYLQIKAQKHISASKASLLFLLESLFAAILSYYFLNENLTSTQMMGCGLVLISAVVVIWSGSRKTDLNS